MQRDFKFRVWDTYGKMMHQNAESGVYEDPDEIYLFHKILEYPKYEVMQFTGLHDKNRKEIYEGDILRREGYWDIKILYNDENASFGWQCVEWVVTQGRTGKTSKEEAKLYEVIGNIYENPELLEAR